MLAVIHGSNSKKNRAAHFLGKPRKLSLNWLLSQELRTPLKAPDQRLQAAKITFVAGMARRRVRRCTGQEPSTQPNCTFLYKAHTMAERGWIHGHKLPNTPATYALPYLLLLDFILGAGGGGPLPEVSSMIVTLRIRRGSQAWWWSKVAF